MTVGLANSGLRDDVHLGCQNNTIGYHSDTGVVVSNHCSRSQTKPPKYGVGKFVDVNLSQGSWSLRGSYARVSYSAQFLG